MYKLLFAKQAQKDLELIAQAPALRRKIYKLLALIESDLFRKPPEYETLRWDLEGCYSRRINRQHRIVYMVDKDLQYVKILQMWTHYENI